MARIWTLRASTSSIGRGEATTRRKPAPSDAIAQPCSLAIAWATMLSYTGPTGFDGIRKAGSSGSTITWLRTTAIGRSSLLLTSSACSAWARM